MYSKDATTPKLDSRSGVMASGHAVLLSPSNYFNLKPHTEFPAEPKEKEGNVPKGERKKISP